MKLHGSILSGIHVFEPDEHSDKRGYLFESFSLNSLEHAIGGEIKFKQENVSFSKKNTLRGLHFQKKPYTQSKLLYVVNGEIFDVCVDLRISSPTFGKWFGIYLSSQNKKIIWVPNGFAHGFLTTSEHATVVYKMTNHYKPKSSFSIRWNDPNLEIDWPIIQPPVTSEQDDNANTFENYLRHPFFS